jgi:carbonic anhydrase/acetyltransferase-like protein (isoleucine patch superfamily)
MNPSLKGLEKRYREVVVNSKYELTKETITTPSGVVLHRIRALRPFANVKEGELGGFIQDEKNLAVTGDAWVADSAQVFGDAHVFSDAYVYGDAQVFGNAQIFGDARVFGDAQVSGYAWVSGQARVYGQTCVHDQARVYDQACVSGDAHIFGQARIYNQAHVSGDAWVSGQARISGNTWEISPLQIQGTAHFLSVSSCHEITIGCERRTVTDWLEKYKTIGKYYGYSEQQLLEYGRYIRMAASWIEMFVTKDEPAGEEAIAELDKNKEVPND